MQVQLCEKSMCDYVSTVVHGTNLAFRQGPGFFPFENCVIQASTDTNETSQIKKQLPSSNRSLFVINLDNLCEKKSKNKFA